MSQEFGVVMISVSYQWAKICYPHTPRNSHTYPGMTYFPICFRDCLGMYSQTCS